jgi:hypothetical protein
MLLSAASCRFSLVMVSLAPLRLRGRMSALPANRQRQPSACARGG